MYVSKLFLFLFYHSHFLSIFSYFLKLSLILLPMVSNLDTSKESFAYMLVTWSGSTSFSSFIVCSIVDCPCGFIQFFAEEGRRMSVETSGSNLRIYPVVEIDLSLKYCVPGCLTFFNVSPYLGQ